MPETDFLKSLGETAGLAGIAVGASLLLLRNVIAKALKVETERGYRLLRLSAVLAFAIGLAGIGIEALSGSGDNTETHGPNSPIVKDTNGPVTIHIEGNAGSPKPDPKPGAAAPDGNQAGSGQKASGVKRPVSGSADPKCPVPESSSQSLFR